MPELDDWKSYSKYVIKSIDELKQSNSKIHDRIDELIKGFNNYKVVQAVDISKQKDRCDSKFVKFKTFLISIMITAGCIGGMIGIIVKLHI